MSLRLLFTALALLLSVSLCRAQEEPKYDLRGPGLAPGTRLEVHSSFKMSQGRAEFLAKGHERAGTMNAASELEAEFRILSQAGSRVTAAEIFYRDWRQNSEIEFVGKPNAEKKLLPLHGRTVTRRLEDGKWTAQMKGVEPTEEQRHQLSQDDGPVFDDYFPDAPIALGEIWTVEPARLRDFISHEAGDLTGEATCALVAIKEFEGQQCAVISIMAKVAFTQTPLRGDAQRCQAHLSATVYRSLAESLDLKVELTGILRIATPVSQPEGTAELVFAGPWEETIARRKLP